jgi:hypothetical protein
MLDEFWQNFTHNLFKPLLLFLYFGFLIPILKVRFEFPYVIYQGLTMYLLVAIGWQGGEELAKTQPADIDNIAGFTVVGFALNFAIGCLAYLLLTYMTRLRRVDRATVAGYYGSDSAGTFGTCVAVLAGVHIAFNAYMPVLLAVMEIPGCLVALYLVAPRRSRSGQSRHRRAAPARSESHDRGRTRCRAGAGVLDGKAGAPELGARPGSGDR